MEKLYNIISLGAGVQSSTMALMAACGEITPMPDAAIFADTQAEPKAVYDWLYWLEQQLPFPVYRVTKGDLLKTLITKRIMKDGQGEWVESNVPAYTINNLNKKGQVMRQCTTQYKIIPIIKQIKKICHINRNQKHISVYQWLGISVDESHRMKVSRYPFIKNIYPLIDAGVSRADCLNWMSTHNYPKPPRSACIFCPYHNNVEWLEMQQQHPDEFNLACMVDETHRNIKYEVSLQRNIDPDKISYFYLHHSRTPLQNVVFDKKSNQINLFGNECEGMCGV